MDVLMILNAVVYIKPISYLIAIALLHILPDGQVADIGSTKEGGHAKESRVGQSSSVRSSEQVVPAQVSHA